MTMRIRLRLWQWLLTAAIFLIVTLALWVKVEQHISRLHYQLVIDGLHAAGQATTFEDFRALAPPIDRQLQLDWDAWINRFNASSDFEFKTFPDHEWVDWVTGRRPQPPDGARANLDKPRALFSDARQLLRRGPPVLSTFVWALMDIPSDQKTLTADEYRGIRTPNLLCLRPLAEWLRQEALLADSPDDGLADLDRLHQGLSAPALLMDVITAFTIDDIRNRCYMELAVTGRLPVAAQERWMAEVATERAMIADGFRDERSLFIPIEVNGLSRLIPGVSAMDKRSALAQILEWPTEIGTCAIKAEMYTQFEVLLRGDVAATPSMVASITAKLKSLKTTNLSESMSLCYCNGLKADVSHRLARLAVRIVEWSHAGIALPADPSELITRLGGPNVLDPGGDHLRVVYERIANDCFRLRIDLNDPLPPLYDKGLASLFLHLLDKPATEDVSIHPSYLQIIYPSYFEIQVRPTGVQPAGQAPRKNNP